MYGCMYVQYNTTRSRFIGRSIKGNDRLSYIRLWSDFEDWSEKSRSIGWSIKENDRLSSIRLWSDFEGTSRNSWYCERNEIEAESMSEAKCSNVNENANANFTLMATKNSKNYLIKTTSMSVGLSKLLGQMILKTQQEQLEDRWWICWRLYAENKKSSSMETGQWQVWAPSSEFHFWTKHRYNLHWILIL